jgi:hypothetical protein
VITVPSQTRIVTRVVVKRVAAPTPKPKRHVAHKAPEPSGRPVRTLAAGGALLIEPVRGIAESGSSGETALLLAVGLGLVLLVIGETTFLRFAGVRPAPRRREEDELPIQRVQLRR